MKLLDIGEIYNRGLITSGEGQELDIQKAHFIYTFYVLYLQFNLI